MYKKTLIIFMLFCKSVFANESAFIQFIYLPSTEYIVKNETVSDMDMSYEGNLSELPENLKNQLPLRILSKSLIEQEIKTDKRRTDGSYKVEVDVVKQRTYVSQDGENFEEIDKNSRSMEGIKIFGDILNNGSMRFSEMTGDKVNSEMEATIKSVFEQLGNLKFLNGENVKINETVSTKLPIQVPVKTSQPIIFEMEMFYTLTSIVNNIANFDIDFTAIVDQKIKDFNIHITGSGNGKMTYDIDRKFSPSSKSKMIMDMKLPIAGGMLNILSISETSAFTTSNK